jgi:hypothetical protein
MHRTLLLLAFLTSSAIAADDYPAPPTSVIAPLGPVKFGKVIKLVATPLEKPVPDLYSITYTWKVVPKTDDLFVDRLDGTIAWFGSGIEATTYTVILDTSYQYVNEAAKKYVVKVATTELEIQVGETKPPPVDPVDPVVVPDPVDEKIPDGQFKLGQVTYDAVKALSLNKKNRARTAAELARNYRAVASTIQSVTAAGGTMTPQQIIDMTIEKNRTTLGSDLTGWIPALDKMGVAANKIKTQLTTYNAWIAAWTEIATGLEKIK